LSERSTSRPIGSKPMRRTASTKERRTRASTESWRH
jgi:hypothetical protein